MTPPLVPATSTAPMYPRNLTLHHDILIMFMNALSDRNTILSFMCICRFTYSIGIPKLLGFPVRLGDKHDDFSSFSNFILADSQTRARYIREIYIDSMKSIDEKQVLPKFVSVLQRATNLEKFAMHCARFPAESTIISALAANGTVKYLELQTPNAEVATALRAWKAPVKEVKASLASAPVEVLHVFGAAPFAAYTDPTWVFAAFSGTLQKMSLESAESFLAGPIFSFVKELKLNTYSVYTSEVAQAFPNLKNLDVNVLLNLNGDEMHELREENTLQLFETQAWQSLEYVQGTVESVYALALPCAVRHLDIIIHKYCPDPEVSLAVVLNDARPSQLGLRVPPQMGIELDTLEACLRVAKEYVTTLDITYRVPGVNSDINKDVKRLLSQLSSLTALQDLTICIDYTRLERCVYLTGFDSHGKPRGAALPPDAVETTLQQYDMEALATRLAHIIPTLKTVSLIVHGNGCCVWEVRINDQGERTINLTKKSQLQAGYG